MNASKWYKFLLKEETEENKQIILDSIVDKEIIIYHNWLEPDPDNPDDLVKEAHWGERPIIVIDTQYGPMMAYRSTGTSLASSSRTQKRSGEWTYFRGFATHPRNESFFLNKTPNMILNARNDRYLHRIFSTLEDLWSEDQMTKENGFKYSAESPETKEYAVRHQVNKRIQEMNESEGEDKYMLYSNEMMFCAIMNIKFRKKGISLGGEYGFEDDRTIGITPVRSELMTRFDVGRKFLPPLNNNYVPQPV